jgi:hypothetical protein
MICSMGVEFTASKRKKTLAREYRLTLSFTKLQSLQMLALDEPGRDWVTDSG